MPKKMSMPTVESILATLASRRVVLPEGRIRVEMYGDSMELSRELIELIRSGRKRAGTGLLWAYEYDRQDIPEAGQIEVIVDHEHNPFLVTRLGSVKVQPFGDVSAEYAAIEGEGDRSLEYWREGHWAFFSRECRRIGKAPTQQMPVICIVFELLTAVSDGTAT
jgi:uncharacterized protein YhfF